MATIYTGAVFCHKSLLLPVRTHVLRRRIVEPGSENSSESKSYPKSRGRSPQSHERPRSLPDAAPRPSRHTASFPACPVRRIFLLALILVPVLTLGSTFHCLRVQWCLGVSLGHGHSCTWISREGFLPSPLALCRDLCTALPASGPQAAPCVCAPPATGSRLRDPGLKCLIPMISS